MALAKIQRQDTALRWSAKKIENPRDSEGQQPTEYDSHHGKTYRQQDPPHPEKRRSHKAYPAEAPALPCS